MNGTPGGGRRRPQAVRCVLVTGGASFIGAHLCARLLSAGARCCASTTSTPAAERATLIFYPIRALTPGLRRHLSTLRRDLLPVGPAAAMRVLVVHSGSGGSMVAGARRSWSGLRSRAPADWMYAVSGVRPPWAECGRTRL